SATPPTATSCEKNGHNFGPRPTRQFIAQTDDYQETGPSVPERLLRRNTFRAFLPYNFFAQGIFFLSPPCCCSPSYSATHYEQRKRRPETPMLKVISPRQNPLGERKSRPSRLAGVPATTWL